MSRLTPLVRALDGWLRAQTPSGLVQRDEVADLLEQVRDDDALWERQRPRFETVWRRGEERLRGIGHYMSPKIWIGQIGVTIYHSATVRVGFGGRHADSSGSGWNAYFLEWRQPCV